MHNATLRFILSGAIELSSIGMFVTMVLVLADAARPV